MPPRDDRRRRSARETFANCPARYEGEYMKDVANESDATRRGSVWHDAKWRYITALFKAKAVSDHELADEAWHRAITDNPLPTSEYHDARQLWSAWTERYELNLETFHSAEKAVYCWDFMCWLRMDETHVPNTDTFRIIDSKTHWRMPTPEQARQSVQTMMYLSGARILYPGFQTYELCYDFVRMNTSLTVSLSEGELDAGLQWVKESDEAMDIAETTGRFPPKPGAHCSTCRVACPVADDVAIRPLRLLNLTEAQQAAGRIAARAQATAADLEALRGYADEHGPVEAGGLEWAHRPKVFKKYPAAGVANVLAQHDLTFNLWLSYSAVKPLVTSKRKYKALEGDIEQLAIESVRTMFSSRAVVASDATDVPPSEDE